MTTIERKLGEDNSVLLTTAKVTVVFQDMLQLLCISIHLMIPVIKTSVSKAGVSHHGYIDRRRENTFFMLAYTVAPWSLTAFSHSGCLLGRVGDTANLTTFATVICEIRMGAQSFNLISWFFLVLPYGSYWGFN